MNNELKQRAGAYAADRVRPGMVLGLGSGSTAAFFVQELGRRLKEGRLHDVVGVPTSLGIERLARESGVPTATLDAHPALDLTVDGADEVDPKLNLIKGLGGALFREKTVAVASERTVIIVDESKLTRRLGERVPIPIAVVPFGWCSVVTRLEMLGGTPSLRTGSEGQPFVTDDGHYVLDCGFGPLEDPHRLADQLRSIVGMVEHGLFLGIAHEVIVATADRVTVLTREGQ